MIFRFVRVQMIVKWLKDNFNDYQTPAPRDGWRDYLSDNGGVGGTLHDLESSYLAAQGFTEGKLSERWVQLTMASTETPDLRANWRQRLQAFFQRAFNPSGGSYLVQEDGSSKFTLEAGGGSIILE